MSEGAAGQRAMDSPEVAGETNGAEASPDSLPRPAVSMRAFADMVGAEIKTVRQAVALGRVPLNESGLVEYETAIPLWTALRDESKVRAPRASSPAPPPKPRSDILDRAVRARNLINEAKAEKEVWAAKMAKLNYEEKAGKLVNAEEVRQAAFNQGRRIRERLRAMVTRVGPAIAGVADPHQCIQMLEREISRALEEDGEEAPDHVEPTAAESAGEVPKPTHRPDDREPGGADPPPVA